MQPSYLSITQLFSQQVRYTVPLFQRPYVWNQEDQWEPLWDDFLGLMRRMAGRAGDAPVAGHFLGTIVLEQVSTTTGSVSRREVIDGQQRLTTLQLLLKAIEHALADAAATAVDDARPKILLAGRQLGNLTGNLVDPGSDELFKVWPTNEDRAAFRDVMASEAEATPAEGHSRMADAYRFFRASAAALLAGDDLGAAAQQLAAAVQNHMRVMVLDLDVNDEPQAIFETLNAHGTPLLPADLIKNWLLWEGARQKRDLDSLYVDHWRRFDRHHEYWRQVVGTGHAARARVDTFLQNWLVKEIVEPISSKHLYQAFLRYVDAAARGSDVAALMRQIGAAADHFETIDRPGEGGRFVTFLHRLQAMDIVVFHPLLMAILDRPGLVPADLAEAAAVLESFLVRRMVCGYQTRGYGTLNIALLKALAEAGPAAPVAPTLHRWLSVEVAGSYRWPDDAEMREFWLTRRFAGALRRERVFMLLRALEELEQARAVKSEVVTINWSMLQIEHIMPQRWQEHWELPADGSAPARDTSVANIGNLTLLGDKLNPSLSNAAWLPKLPGGLAKRPEIAKHCRLECNRSLVGEEQWDEARIRARAERMFDLARTIWPEAAQALVVNTSAVG